VPTTIKLGDSGDDVKRLQRVFAQTKVLGPDSVTGVFGPQAEQAVKDFQQSNGLVVDGVVGPITWSHIHPYREASPTLRAGSLGPVVAIMQGVLKTGFGYAGAIDGIFGPVEDRDDEGGMCRTSPPPDQIAEAQRASCAGTVNLTSGTRASFPPRPPYGA
jgi:peptidoglycan hydrolase-like protein with peptidoglycan-binding domain